MIVRNARAMLCGVTGFFSGRSVEVCPGETLAIGRDRAECAILYPPDYVRISGVHCTVRLNPNGQLVLVDTDSANGTFMQGRQRLFPGREYALGDGAVFSLVDSAESFCIRFETDGRNVEAEKIHG